MISHQLRDHGDLSNVPCISCSEQQIIKTLNLPKLNKYVTEREVLNFKFHDLPIISRQFPLLTLENFYCESFFT